MHYVVVLLVLKFRRTGAQLEHEQRCCSVLGSMGTDIQGEIPSVQERILQLRNAAKHTEWKPQQQSLSDARVRLQGNVKRAMGSQCRMATAQAMLNRLGQEGTSDMHRTRSHHENKVNQDFI